MLIHASQHPGRGAGARFVLPDIFRTPAVRSTRLRAAHVVFPEILSAAGLLSVKKQKMSMLVYECGEGQRILGRRVRWPL